MNNTRNPTKVLVESRMHGIVSLVFFGKSLEILAKFDVDLFSYSGRKVIDRLYELAWQAACHENGLKLLPCYPPGRGIFIGGLRE